MVAYKSLDHFSKMPRPNIVVVIPTFKCSKTICDVVEQCLLYASYVIVVDDCCPDQSGAKVLNSFDSQRVFIKFNPVNLGVGGATKVGFDKALELDADIVVKVDADGQMDPSLIPSFILPISDSKAQYVKGNRFSSRQALVEMPVVRLIGNVTLSFIAKLSTGYWELLDPTNGFIAIPAQSLINIKYHKASNRYFFETDLLFLAGLSNLNIAQVSHPALYRNHNSSLNPIKEIPGFLTKNIKIFLKRIAYDYIIFDFNPGSLCLIFGFIFTIISIIIFGWRISAGGISYTTAPGILTIFSISTMLAVQFSLGFLFYDSIQKPLLRRLNNLMSGKSFLNS